MRSMPDCSTSTESGARLHAPERSPSPHGRLSRISIAFDLRLRLDAVESLGAKEWVESAWLPGAGEKHPRSASDATAALSKARLGQARSRWKWSNLSVVDSRRRWPLLHRQR